MTDTEAKALAKRASIGLTPYEAGVLAHYIEATEARHAAELREQAERFSEAAEKALYQMRANQLLQASVQPILTPFIIAKPDPLVEVCREIGLAPYRPDELRAALAARGGKIVWGADQ